MLLFKYVGPGSVPRVFAREDELAIRFGLPKTYNDPYELFLEPSPPLESEELRAFYDFFLGQVVEAPVACFSTRPDSVVMWAHYGVNGSGVCLAFDEDQFVEQFPIAVVGDVTYADQPATVDSGLVDYAFTTGKRRHALRLLEVAHRAAYFMKRSDWLYENERRVVVPSDAVENRDGVLIGRIKPDALRYVILGPKADPTTRELSETRARQYNVPLIHLRIGARTYTPFFTGAERAAFAWDSDHFERLQPVCGKCGEPAIVSEEGECEWCSIDDEVRESAPKRSLLTLTLYYGVDKGLPFVFDGMRPRGRLVKEDSGDTQE